MGIQRDVRVHLRPRSPYVLGAVLGVVGTTTIATTAVAGEYQWSHAPVRGQTTSYTDPANWTPPPGDHAPPPGAGDIAVFNTGSAINHDVSLSGPIEHQQLPVLDGIVLLGTTSVGTTTLTLTRADNLALQIGTVIGPSGGSASFEPTGLHLHMPYGGITVSAVMGLNDNILDATLFGFGTAITTRTDFVLGTNGGDGFAALYDPAAATIGGSVWVGRGGHGQLEVYDGYAMDVAGDLVIADTNGYEGYVTIQNIGDTKLPTGITVGGDVHVGGSPAGAGGTADVFLYDSTYLLATGDWIFHEAPNAFPGSGVVMDTNSRGAGRHVTVGRNSAFTIGYDSRFDASGDVTIESEGWLDVFQGSVLTAGGTVRVDAGGTLVVDDSTVSGDIVNHGTVRIRGTGDIADAPGSAPATLAALAAAADETAGETFNFTQSPDGVLLIQVDSATDYGRLIVSGTATLDGMLSLQFGRLFEPVEGMTFDLIDAALVTGAFDQVVVGPAGSGWFGAVDPATGAVTLSQVPEPSAAIALLGTGAALTMRRRRRRRTE